MYLEIQKTKPKTSADTDWKEKLKNTKILHCGLVWNGTLEVLLKIDQCSKNGEKFKEIKQKQYH